uniref:IgGFc-binding protein N-terminal domain-containing protein n=1 Tax=Biomphalaria glabrata TaxID=6526 RepID=A0A2C9L8P8_BIOGL
MGKEYLISTPAIVSSSGAKQVSSITMYLVTYVPPIQLSFLVHWTPQGKNKKIPNYVIASKVYTIVVDPIYCYNKLPGIRWTFHLIGSNYFGLVVSLMEHGAPHMETFVPLPVAGWGKEYFAVTMGYRYSIIIIANDGPNQIFLP